MRRGSRKMWWVVPCTSRKSLRTGSRMNIEEMLKAKLATIKEEEPEICTEENNETGLLPKHNNSTRCVSGKEHKIYMMKVKMRHFLRPQFSFKDSYVLFMTGFASTRTLGGLSQC